MIQVEEKSKSERLDSEKVTDELKLLISLQDLDTRIFRLKEKKAEIPRKVEALQASIKKGKDQLEERRSEYEQVKKLKKEKEIELDEGLDRLKKLKARISEIKTNEQYQAHLKEVETAEKVNRGIEDEILSLMEKIEEAYKLLEEEEASYAEVLKKFEKEREGYDEEGKSIEEELSKLREERKEIASKISQQLYDNYSKTLRYGKGIAIVPIKGGTCSGCNMSLPPQVINDVRKCEEIIDCSNCHRILYYEGIGE